MSDYFASWHAREQRAFARAQRRYDNMNDDPSYQDLVAELAKECRCKGDRPCDGLLAGGFCDSTGSDEVLSDQQAEAFVKAIRNWKNPLP